MPDFSRIFYGAGVTCLLVGLVLFSMRQSQFGDLERWAIEDTSIVEGVLEIPRHTGQSTPIAIRTRDGIVFSCCIAHCGYEGVRSDLGKHAKIWILNGIFAQIEVDGVIKVTLSQRVAALQSDPSKLAMIISPLLIVLGYCVRRQKAATSGVI
jgi:hypothetical protein